MRLSPRPRTAPCCQLTLIYQHIILNESSNLSGAQGSGLAAVAINRTHTYKRNWPGGIPEHHLRSALRDICVCHM